MSLPRFDELERLVDGLPRRLTRSVGFVLILIVAPSRGALRHARARCEAMVTSAGRAFVVGLPTEAPKGPSPMVWVAGEEPDWRARAETLVRVNIARDALHLAGCGIILGLLDVDYPRFGALAPDLWSVRTAVFRHDQADPLPAMPRVAKGAGVPQTDAPVPPELEALARTLPLRALRVREGEGDAQALTLDSLYVPLDAVGDGSLTDGPPKPGNVKKLLESQRLAVLEAPAGAGKSTALRRAARDWARAGESVLWAPARRLPERLWGDELLDDLTALQSVCPWPVVQNREPTVVLDGLDELGDPDARAALALAVADLVLLGLVERAALSARPGALGGGGPIHPGDAVAMRAIDALTRLRLLPLSAEQMRTYVTQWAEATEPKQSQRAELRQRLVSALGLGAKESDLASRQRALCERPLFLAVLCALVWGGGAQPERESELLDALVTASIRPAVHGGLRASDLRWLAGKVAWEMHSTRRTTLPAYSLVEGDVPLLEPTELEALRLQTGLLVESGEEVSFSHLALQELLAAERAWDYIEWWNDNHLISFLWGGDLFSQMIEVFGVGGVARLFLESYGERAPVRLEGFIRRTGGHPNNVADLLAQVWPIRPPLALRGLWSDTVALLFAEHGKSPGGDWKSVLRRNSIATRLAALGDDRIGRREWCDVGDGWQVARWPITLLDFQAFIEDGGYIDDSFWSDAGRRWKRTPSQARSKERPAGWAIEGIECANRAAQGLSRHEAEAFIAWSQRSDSRICLPPESVWLRAARGAAHFDATPEWLRQQETSDWATLSVGSMPELASTAGVEDLGVLVRERLAPETPDEREDRWAGCSIAEPLVPLHERIGLTARPDGRRDHHFGLRLARRPPNR